MTEKLRPEDFIENFELMPEESAPQSESDTISIWLSLDQKAKYDLIQARSKKKFGKFLKKIIEKTIDRVDLTKKAA